MNGGGSVLFTLAGRWARQFLISEGGFEAAATQAESELVELIRVRWRGRTRRIIVGRALTQSRVRNVQEPLDPSPFNPWTESAEPLAARTRQSSRCRTCEGEKKVRCPLCGGSATIVCDVCNGSGLTWSPRPRRKIGCRSCRGKPEGLMSLAFVHLNLPAPDLETAEKEAREALRLQPDWSYVKDVLLPQIEKARAGG